MLCLHCDLLFDHMKSTRAKLEMRKERKKKEFSLLLAVWTSICLKFYFSKWAHKSVVCLISLSDPGMRSSSIKFVTLSSEGVIFPLFIFPFYLVVLPAKSYMDIHLWSPRIKHHKPYWIFCSLSLIRSAL